MAEPNQLDVARRRFPVGDHVTGQVIRIPRPGAIGLLVDLGQEPEGFVDVLALPHDPVDWPSLGTVMRFEVLQHRPGQVGLLPLDASFRSGTYLPTSLSHDEWLSIKMRFPVGSAITGTVTHVFTSNREYVVRFEDCSSALEWSRGAPTVGATGRYTIARHLDHTRRVMLTPADSTPH
ncbi:hypothetical protein EV384_0888 [Micromonospora kangleipakensis]|uniref:S1 motif domain-containing protein n=1 Tax=Micromonospora kangleipakensis TaxID=1077942 RepID=A0A4Q8B6Q8_9ACTN|nr:hypothetical protein [Micromonospora kangleipakensis]RZU72519.1 hypothetical protein EV384_0888 [Micromonospora kangleipakensis]